MTGGSGASNRDDAGRHVPPEFSGPWCSNTDCPCGTAGPVCSEFLGFPDPNDNADPEGQWCPRCGWNEPAHTTPATGDDQEVR